MPASACIALQHHLHEMSALCKGGFDRTYAARLQGYRFEFETREYCWRDGTILCQWYTVTQVSETSITSDLVLPPLSRSHERGTPA